MCGLCIPSCPTYQVSQDENLSPRGRISLIQAIAQKKIKFSTKLESHLDSCLQCMSCQLICPSQVNYSDIISYGQEVIFTHKPQGFLKGFSLHTLILANSRLKSFFIMLINVLIRIKLMQAIKFLTKNTGFKKVGLLPDKLINTSLVSIKPARIVIFSGCANSIFDSQLIQHSYLLLKNIITEQVSIDNQNCCGTIFKKEGNINAYKLSISKIKQYYANPQHLNSQGTGKQVLISLNSSCSASLIKSFAPKANKPSITSKDIISFLANDYYQILSKTKFTAFKTTVFFHQSCSMKNLLKSQTNCLKLIELIPQIKIKMHSHMSCCGASGNYMFSHGDLAEKIATPLVDFIRQEDIHIMLSTDISCSLHIKQQLQKQNYHLEILHPVSLLYQQIDNK